MDSKSGIQKIIYRIREEWKMNSERLRKAESKAAAAFMAGIIFFSIPGLSVSAKKKQGIVKEGAYKYYYNEKGKKATKFVKVDKDTYYFTPQDIVISAYGNAKKVNPKASMVKGWYKISGKYYYFDRDSGKMAVNTTVDGIKVNKKGIAKTSKYNIEKMDTMIRARELMQTLTEPKDSKAKKTEKCFNYVLKDVGLMPWRFLNEERSKKDWDLVFANDIIDPKSHDIFPYGDCTSFACGFAYLAHECGNKKVLIIDNGSQDKLHAWVEIDGLIYDCMYAKENSLGGMQYNYKAKYTSASPLPHVAANVLDISTGKVSKR